MRIKWLAGSSFLIVSDTGTRIITDPYSIEYEPEIPFDDPEQGNFMRRLPVTELADVVTITHGHFDHSGVFSIQGNCDGVFQIYKGTHPVEIKGVKFNGITTYHGGHRGTNIVISMEVDGIRILHLGDIGYKFSPKDLDRVGKVDILFIPWDDNDITLPFDVVDELISQVNPKVVFPMHHVVVDDFFKNKRNAFAVDSCEIEFTSDSLPATTRIILLRPDLQELPLELNK